MRILIDGQTLATPDMGRGIGRVFRGLCNALIARDISRQWLLALPEGCDAGALSEEARRRVVCHEVPAPRLASGFSGATVRHREALQAICDSEGVDLFWCPNPLMLNVALPLGLEVPATVCTVFDIIPARLPGTHQVAWSDAAKIEYALRLEGLPSWSDQLVFISEAARRDFVDFDPRVEERSSAVPLAVDQDRFWASASILAPPEPASVLLVAGADPRKNTLRAIDAFARVLESPSVSPELILELVGGHDPHEQEQLRARCAERGVEDRVRLRGRVDDATLSRLYREAAALLFPSLYEGFGLPVLEAMASGTPVVVSDRPELHECAGEHGVYCDPLDTDEIAEKLLSVLADPVAARVRCRPAIAHAQQFTWERCAARYISLFDDLRARGSAKITGDRLRVGWASPWPPDRSGIADYSFEIVRQLRGRVDLEILTPHAERTSFGADVRVNPLRRLSKLNGRFDRIIYHLGNSANFHRELYRAAWESPGIVVLHDFNIHPFLQHAYLGTPDEYLYKEALEQGYGDAGRVHFENVQSRRIDPDIWAFPASRAIAIRSEATIVHSDWVRLQLGEAGRVHVIPHGSEVRPQMDSECQVALRQQLGIPSEDFAIGVFGFLNSHKRIPSILEACRRLRDSGLPVRLMLVGEVNDDRVRVGDELARHDAVGFTRMTGFVSEDDFWTHLDACDVVVNLRHPTMGESSGSLMRALGAGKACIVSDNAQFAELPDAVCWKVSTDVSEVDELTACLTALLCDPALRDQLGSNARSYIESLCSFERAARLYLEVVRSLV